MWSYVELDDYELYYLSHPGLKTMGYNPFTVQADNPDACNSASIKSTIQL